MQDGLERLCALVGRERVLLGREIPALYLRDMLTSIRAFPVPPDGWRPAAVVRPESTESVCAILRTANESGLKVVCWGGGTGLMGAAAAVQGEVILDMRGMGRVLEIDAASRRARVQAGATIQAVEDAARPHGLMLGHDPWTVAQATVGGAIGTDSLGYLAARYGSMGQTVLGLTVVLADGTALTKRAAMRAPGFNVAGLVVGLEGTLAVVTEAVLRLRPIPECREIRAYDFPDFASGFRAACAVVEIGPSLLEFNERFEDPARRMFVGFEGPREAVEGEWRAAERVLGAKPCDAGVARTYWERRHAIAELYARDEQGRSPGDERMKGMRFDYLHVALPLGRVLEYRDRVLDLLSRHGLRVLEDSLWVHPELFSVYFEPAAEDARAMEAAFDEAVRACHAVGGSMEYCHGVGVRLARHLSAELGTGLDAYGRMKSALDARGVLPRLGRGA